MSGKQRTDTERLDWMNKQQRQHHATWESSSYHDEDGFGGGPASWRNPSVSWSISRSMKNGTYQFPPELRTMTLREAIDAAMDAALPAPQAPSPEGA